MRSGVNNDSYKDFVLIQLRMDIVWTKLGDISWFCLGDYKSCLGISGDHNTYNLIAVYLHGFGDQIALGLILA